MSRGYYVNKDFFRKWSKEMSYVLGYIYADGSLENSTKIRGKYLRISSTDKDSILRIRKWLSSQHTIVNEGSKWKNGKDRYLIRIGNSDLYDSLIEKGLYPRKSLSIEFPKIPKKYVIDFIRGYFDGDGCVYPYIIRKNGRNYPRKLSVIFTSGSEKFLIQLSRQISDIMNVTIKKPMVNTRSFQIRYSTHDSLTFFKLLYKNCKKGDYLQRKYERFEYFIETKKTQWRSR